MKSRQWQMAVLCLCLTLAPLSVQAKDNVSSIKSEINKLQQMLKDYKSDRSGLSKDLQRSEKEISNIQGKMRKIQRDLKEEDSKLKKLHKEREELDKAKHGQQQAIKSQLNLAYKSGRQQKVKVILNQEDPTKLARMMIYYDYLNRANMAQIKAFNHTIDRLNTLEPEMENSRNLLALSKNKLALQHQSLKKQQLKRRQTLAKIDKSIVDKNHQLKREQVQLDKLVKAIAARVERERIARVKREHAAQTAQAAKRARSTTTIKVSKGTSFQKRRGKMAWPAKGRLINSFGSRRNASGIRWQGVNIAATAGSDVKAIHPGRVVFSDWFRGLGMLVIIDHGNGYLSLYAHNKAVFPAPGDWIQNGQTIATVGSSGGQKKPSLYFEIRQKGKPTNPKLWCK